MSEQTEAENLAIYNSLEKLSPKEIEELICMRIYPTEYTDKAVISESPLIYSRKILKELIVEQIKASDEEIEAHIRECIEPYFTLK